MDSKWLDALMEMFQRLKQLAERWWSFVRSNIGNVLTAMTPNSHHKRSRFRRYLRQHKS